MRVYSIDLHIIYIYIYIIKGIHFLTSKIVLLYSIVNYIAIKYDKKDTIIINISNF